MSDLIERDEVIKALRLEYPMMPFFKENQKEWAIKTEGYRKAEEVIMKLPSARQQGEWAPVLAELHEQFFALEKEIRKASAEMSAIIRKYVDRQDGEWISEGRVYLPTNGYHGAVCSICGTESEYLTNFCGECGADMRGERSGTDKDKFEQ